MDTQLLCDAIRATGATVPCTSVVFLAALLVHVPFSLTCVVTGIVAMFSRKGAGRHPSAGAIYYWALSVVFVTATALSAMRWDEDWYLFVLGTLSFAAASFGRLAHRRRWHHWVRLHIAGMGSSYILLLTAFYVDNGKNLPLWKELPTIAYWVLPSAVGIPLIVYALLNHPLVRSPKSSVRAAGG